MNANTTAIANHLNVIESAILEVQEWASVLWVRVQGLGARFVSKKIGASMETQFGQQQHITTPNGGWAIFYSSSNKYEVGSRMWSNGGGSIVGYAYDAVQLKALLQKAESESLHSRQMAESRGEAYSRVPDGYEVNTTGELELIIDLSGFNSELY